jgi:hypothetical protein
MPDDRVVVVRASAASLLLCRLKTATRTEIRDSGGVSPIILLLCQQVLRYSLEDYYCSVCLLVGWLQDMVVSFSVILILTHIV